ncbi:MAG: 3-oxoacyl-ACP synthase [Bdellovibrionaceae bacterium]|nr:3-oxoacyl-ACP synthase [Pseudobdellovibrionaceae bacterium]
MRKFSDVFITGVGHYLPGPKISSDEMDSFVGLINPQSERIKRRILAENGIKTRHYAIQEDGSPRMSMAEMASQSVHEALRDAGIKLQDIGTLATGTVSGDVIVPGFANMLQGELKAPPMETISVNGICSSGMIALKAAAETVESKEHPHALVNATEFPSRMFKKSRFSATDQKVDFNAHFLRWMLSDGSGSFVLSEKPKNSGISFKLNWIHTRSFSGDYPTCMSIGFGEEGQGKSFLDWNSVGEAEQNGSFYLRQDIRLLPNIFEVGFSEYLQICKQGHIRPLDVDHFLCHYSSEKFSHTIKDLMKKADVFIPEDRWYSNLSQSGNTGSASIFIMLSEFLKEKNVEHGQKILLFVPESGRFTVSFAMLEVISNTNINTTTEDEKPPLTALIRDQFPQLFLELSAVWNNYRSTVLRTTLCQKIFSKNLTIKDYQTWMSFWIPQVKEGAVWMREAIAHAPEDLKGLTELIETHATEEQFDFNILYTDYKLAGGDLPLESLQRTPGGDALNAYMMSMARSNPLALLGGIFIIEGTGQKIIPSLLPFLKDSLTENLNIYRFLQYHGENDQNHLERWATAVSMALEYKPELAQEITDCANTVAKLYLMQWMDISKKVSLHS